MTVCIAAICEGGDAIVFAADRYRWHGTAAMEVDLDEPKFFILSDRLGLMGSGDGSIIEDVIRRFHALPPDPGLTAISAADKFQVACQAAREKRIETMYSKRFLGLNFAEFRTLLASANPGSIALDLYNKALSFDFGTVLIVGGIDDDGAHLHAVDDGGNVSGTETGYLAIGSGGALATVALARRSHKKTAPLGEALYNVYEAKRTAELARGVGITTDMGVIRKGQPKRDIGEGTMAALEAAFDRLKPQSISADEIAAIAASL